MIAEGYRPNCAVPELEAVLGKPTVRNFRGRLETWVMVGLGTRSIIERVENGNSGPRLRAPVLYPTEERAARYLHDVCMFRRERDRALQERDQARGAEAYWRGIAAVPMGSPDLAPFKRPLALAHPDKWSQGQPAVDLAHELAIAINAAREKLEGLP